MCDFTIVTSQHTELVLRWFKYAKTIDILMNAPVECVENCDGNRRCVDAYGETNHLHPRHFSIVAAGPGLHISRAVDFTGTPRRVSFTKGKPALASYGSNVIR